MQIGLLEDDTAIQEMLCIVLKDAGYDVIMYSTANDCLNTLFASVQEQNSSPLDLLIVDWRLLGPISGTDVIRQLRANDTLRSLPIILTTAATITDDELRGMHVKFLEKPFAIVVMVNLIKSLV